MRSESRARRATQRLAGNVDHAAGRISHANGSQDRPLPLASRSSRSIDRVTSTFAHRFPFKPVANRLHGRRQTTTTPAVERLPAGEAESSLAARPSPLRGLPPVAATLTRRCCGVPPLRWHDVDQAPKKAWRPASRDGVPAAGEGRKRRDSWHGPAAGVPGKILLCRVRHALPCGGQGLARRRQRLRPRPPPPPLAANGGGRGRAAGTPLPLPRMRRRNPSARPSTAGPTCVASHGRSALVRIDSRPVRGRRPPTSEDPATARGIQEQVTQAGRSHRESPPPARSAASGTTSI